MCAFEFGIEYTTGRANLQHTALGAIKGFLAVSLFTILPVRLYALSVSLQGRLSAGPHRLRDQYRGCGAADHHRPQQCGKHRGYDAGDAGFWLWRHYQPHHAPVLHHPYGLRGDQGLFRKPEAGGILLIQIAVGSLYMFSIPRGYVDGFVQWMKQVIGLCLTAFLQSTILVAGLMVFKDHALLGLGLMLSAGEVPRIAGTFGLDTTTRANIMSAVYTAQAAVNTTRTIAAAVAPK